MKKAIILISLAFITALSMAQKIDVTSFKLLDNDLTANTEGTIAYDQNGNKAALIKVVTTQTGFSFDCGSLGIVKTIQKPSEVWVYVPQGVRKITIMHPTLGILRDYTFPINIEKAKTYEMRISSEQQSSSENYISGQYIVMKVEPQTALVKIDSIEQTPNNGIITKLLGFGKHTYFVSDPLYHSEVGEFSVTSIKKEINISLRPAYGILEINTTPENGAKVFIDNEAKPLGLTPLKTDKLIEGNHIIRCQLPLYKSTTLNLNVKGDGTVQNISIPMTPNFGTLNIDAPLESHIYVNGEEKSVSHWTGRLTEGLYVIEARKESYKSTFQNIKVENGQIKNIIMESPQPIYGALDISSEPIGCDVFIDNVNKGTTPIVIPQVLIGNHKISIRKNGYNDSNSEINVLAKETQKINKVLTPKEIENRNNNVGKGNTVHLKFNTNISMLYIDGHYVENEKKKSFIQNLSKGKHVIEASAIGYKFYSKEINVISGGQEFIFYLIKR